MYSFAYLIFRTYSYSFTTWAHEAKLCSTIFISSRWFPSAQRWGRLHYPAKNEFMPSHTYLSPEQKPENVNHIVTFKPNMFKLSELVRWLGLTEFEILTNLVAILVFSIILTLKLSGDLAETSIDWFGTFTPLFCGDVCNAYFCVIVGIRMYISNDNKRKALHRFLWSTYFLVLTAIFKYLLCLKLSGQTGLEYSEVFSPIFVLLQLVAVRACQLPNSN